MEGDILQLLTRAAMGGAMLTTLAYTVLLNWAKRDAKRKHRDSPVQPWHFAALIAHATLPFIASLVLAQGALTIVGGITMLSLMFSLVLVVLIPILIGQAFPQS